MKTGVQWADRSLGFWFGCLKVSQGCRNCYAARAMKRYGKKFEILTKAKGFNKPLRWKGPARIFVNPWSDFFLDEAFDRGWVDQAWEIIRRTPDLTYMVLTKRADNIKDMLPDDWDWENGWDNVWLGVSIENDDSLWRLEFLDAVAAKVKFVSYEPALEYVDFTTYSPAIDWLIAGGESGPGYRPANPHWFRRVQADCFKNEIPFFFKQFGGTKKVDGAWGGCKLDGKIWHQLPK